MQLRNGVRKKMIFSQATTKMFASSKVVDEKNVNLKTKHISEKINK